MNVHKKKKNKKRLKHENLTLMCYTYLNIDFIVFKCVYYKVLIKKKLKVSIQNKQSFI